MRLHKGDNDYHDHNDNHAPIAPGASAMLAALSRVNLTQQSPINQLVVTALLNETCAALYPDPPRLDLDILATVPDDVIYITCDFAFTESGKGFVYASRWVPAGEADTLEP